MKGLRAREGDFLETIEGLIFDVKGLVHPPDRVIAYLRYLEDPSGDRRRDGKSYVKVYSLSARENLLRGRYPHYLFYDPVFDEDLEGVPYKFISRLYEPEKKVAELLKKPELDQVERDSVEFVKILSDASNVPFGKFGLSGSVLVGLHMDASDIDVIVCGKEGCFAVYESLKQLMSNAGGTVSSYSQRDLEKLYEFRSKDTWMPFADFYRTERRKFMQGKFRGRDFFMRFIQDWNEVSERYGDRLYRAAGYAKVNAEIEDDTESVFTPCRYVISEVEFLEGTEVPCLREIVSFRGRFCEQATKGEMVVAQGKLEKVVEKDGEEYFRLILGAKPSDFMMSKTEHVGT